MFIIRSENLKMTNYKTMFINLILTIKEVEKVDIQTQILSMNMEY